jgi:plasmid stability protein
MSTQPLTIQVPTPLYQHLQQRANEARRSVEEETLQVLAAAVPTEGVLPEDMANAIRSLDALDDAALWKTARHRLADDVSEQLEAFHAKKGSVGLSDAESQQLADLIRRYEFSMLLRAQAAALLKRRGHDVTELVHS